MLESKQNEKASVAVGEGGRAQPSGLRSRSVQSEEVVVEVEAGCMQED